MTNRFGKLTMGDAYVKWFRTQQYYDAGTDLVVIDGGVALVDTGIPSGECGLEAESVGE